MNVRELRTLAGMTQKEFADYFDIPFRSLQNWEGGQRKAPDYLIKLLEYKLIKEGIVMTNEYLEKNAVKIDVVDMRDGGIYLGTHTFYLLDNCLYASEYHSNLNRYTGNNKTYILIDDVKRNLEKYNDEYFICEIGLTEEGYENLLNVLANKAKEPR